MTTLIVNIKDSADANKIAEAMRLIKGVVKVENKKQTFEEAATNCNAVSLDTFNQMFTDEIRKAYSI
ncbi:hypothetical protein [Parabacteroides sp. PF5-6]|uniref:hypothetical protein n=1 Tax=Parabacteroides sp. PF5-6 TaxID=1742403 RepID=UPI002406BA31|nr:hypothetical protein [Parabacteroides sp. PF5-6]MDF9830751.1 cell division protein FtsX [Parabacteroides sp. PF5-6]